MPAVRIEPLPSAALADAAELLARAFVTNPLHEAAFGPAALTRNVAFFRTGLSVMKGPKLVAVEDGRLLGLVHWVRWPACRISGLDKLRQAPAMIRGFGPRSALRVGRWLSSWSAHDPPAEHCHLGPVGVDPGEQGRGIGRLLMEKYCEELDRSGEPGYLETDRAENVAFYRRFGFEVTTELEVLGVRNYLMSRRARSPGP